MHHLRPSINNPTFRRHVVHLVALGPRAVAEFLLETGRQNCCTADISERLAAWRSISPEMLRLTGGDRFPATIWRAA